MLLLGSNHGVRLSAACYAVGKKKTALVLQEPVKRVLCSHVEHLLLSNERASHGVPAWRWGERCLRIQSRLRCVPSYMSRASLQFKNRYDRILGNDDVKRFVVFGSITGDELGVPILLRSYSQVELERVLYLCCVTLVGHFVCFPGNRGVSFERLFSYLKQTTVKMNN